MSAVAQFEEAMGMWESGVTQYILILGRCFPNEIPIAIKNGFRITLFGSEHIRSIEEVRQELPAFVHVNVETGIGRIGLLLGLGPHFFDDLIHSKHYICWGGV